jgi:hypothetical protein
MVFLPVLMVDCIRIFKETTIAFKITFCYCVIVHLDLLLSANRIVFVLWDNTHIIVPYKRCAFRNTLPLVC